MKPGTPIEDFPQYEGLVAAFPINDKGKECIWRGVSETIEEWVDKGYVSNGLQGATSGIKKQVV